MRNTPRNIARATMAIVCMCASFSKASASDCPSHKDTELRVGRMIVAGFFGQKSSDPGFHQILANLENGIIGGVLFLGRNIDGPKDLQDMTTQIAKCKCHRVPLIAIDEEGGVIERLGSRVGLEGSPPASDVARLPLTSAHAVDAKIAEKIKSFGFNMNLGPVVDLNRNPENPVIGQLGRSYGSNVDTVVRYATAFIEEHRKRNIVTVLKHFPGHGSSSADSHDGIANVTSTWSPQELLPFKRLISAELTDVVMVGHLANPAKWGGVATQSKATAISQMLRKELEYNGVVMTDDLAMKAVSDGKTSTVNAAVDAIKAGADMLLVGRLGDDDQTADVGAEVNRAITLRVCSGEIDGGAILRSVDRIQELESRRIPLSQK